MNRNSVPGLARNLMIQYGVGYLNFGFHGHTEDFPIEYVGKTHFVKVPGGPYLASKITISHDWMPYLTEEEVIRLIKHEIAHARCAYGVNHGKAWREMCWRMGIEPSVKFHTADCPPELR